MSRSPQSDRVGFTMVTIVASVLMTASPAIAETVSEPDPHSIVSKIFRTFGFHATTAPRV